MEQARTKGALKLFMSPSSSGTVLLTIPNRALVSVEKKTNDMWWLVGYKGKTGYVMRSLLESYKGPDLVNEMVALPREVVVDFYEACRIALKRKDDDQ